MPTTIKLEKGIKVKPDTDVIESPFYKLVQGYFKYINAKEEDVLREASPWARIYGIRVGDSDYAVSFLLGLEKSDVELPDGRDEAVLSLETAFGRVDEGTNIDELNKRISYLNLNTKQFPLSFGVNKNNQAIARFSSCECGGTETAKLVLENIVSVSLSALKWLMKDCGLKPFYEEVRETTHEEKEAS